jgi:hypothetical protein
LGYVLGDIFLNSSGHPAAADDAYLNFFIAETLLSEDNKPVVAVGEREKKYQSWSHF